MQLVAGLSLVARAAEIARSLEWIDAAIISTDDPEIAEEGQRHGLDVQAMRPLGLTYGGMPGLRLKIITVKDLIFQ
jgi:CMP-N-acetylneuraminic acid synthetase